MQETEQNKIRFRFRILNGGVAVMLITCLLVFQVCVKQTIAESSSKEHESTEMVREDSTGETLTGAGGSTADETIGEETEKPEEISTEEISTEEISTEEISTEEISTEEISTEEISTEEISTEETSTEEITTEDVVTEESTTEEMTEAPTLASRDESTLDPEQAARWEEWKRKEQEALAQGQNIIYLTFDDGPWEYTPALLDVLDKYGITATFFVTGDAPLYDHWIAMIAERGHAIGLHCSVHWYEEVYGSDWKFLTNMAKIDDMVYQYTGMRTKLMRFPGGSGDGSGETNKDILVANIIEGIQSKKTAIVLQHDTCISVAETAEEVIIWGLENGYIFLPLTENSPKMHQYVVN
ncbi:MAG: polysaccharide deacetylase family protein [Lachnospiraceae bacterium]|nr:polysaccharide deacetylase family protein [Lachnospiraceae bacterium]